MELTRLIVTKPDGTVVGEVDPTRLVDATAASEVNGEHSLTITTLDEYSKGDRILWEDARGYWHEHVVNACDASHEGGMTVYEHYCVWSLQYDLAQTFVSAMPGVQSPTTAREALVAALSGTERWSVGTVGVTTTGGASMWRMSGWEAIGVLVKTWGGEVDADIEVGLSGVVSRSVDLLAHVGATEVTRRFDFGHDVSGLRRNVLDNRWTARVVPLGKGEPTEGGGHGRKVTIESVNGGVLWLENSATVPLVRLPVGSGYEIPVQVVENSDIEDPQTLKDWALANLDEWTTPKVSYELGVIQMAQAGASAQGVSLGDEVYVVDRTFGGDGLALEARVVRIEESLVDPSRLTVTISNVRDGLGRQLGSLSNAVTILSDSLAAQNEYQSSSTYLDELLGRLNDEINATGGYTYITQGEGIRTYDVPVSDPLVGDEASKVVEVKGGNIRIADSKDSAGNWEWKTLIQSGHIASDLIDAITIHSGYIGNYQGNSYWDLDNSNFLFGYDLTPLISEASISVNAQQVLGSSRARFTPNESYIIAFSTTAEIDRNFKVGIATTLSSGAMVTAYPTVVSVSGGSVRYMSTVELVYSYTSVMRAYFVYVGTYDSSLAFTATDVRVYKKPATGDGVMRFEAASESDSVTARILAGSVSVSSDDVVSELTPGVLSLSGIDVPTILQMAPDIGTFYRKSASELLVGKRDGTAGATISLAPSTTPNKLPGMLDYTGMVYRVDTTVADVFSPATGFTLTRGYRLMWGPIAIVQVLLTTPNIPAGSSGTSQRLVGGVKPTPLSEPMAVGQLGSTGSSTPIVLVTDDSMSYRASGASPNLYLPADKTRTSDIASGTRLAVIAIFFVKT